VPARRSRLELHARRLLDGVLEPHGAGPAAQWRAMAFLYLAGGLIGIGTVALGVDPEADETLLACLAVGALAIAAVLAALAERLPRNVMLPSLALGLALTTAAVIASSEADTPYALFYVWIGVAAWFFLGARQAALITATCAVATAGVFLTIQGPDRDAATWWVTINGTVAAVSLCAAILYGRSQRLAARLGAAATHDELTGLLNRRGFRRTATQELKSAARTQRRDAVLYVDLDRFKPINDAHGHAAGDDALRGVADAIRATVRDADFGARLGGDEFAIYAVGVAAGQGHTIAARLRANLDAHNAAAAARGRPFRVELSVGVAELEAGDDLDGLLARADAALYARKLARRG
jgi:diguanylate cyclase (GGDEF)-like protein